MKPAELQRIDGNRMEYIRLKNDSRYTNVKFNENTGGLLAIHKEHHFDPTVGRFGIPRGDYERIAAEVLYSYGRSVVLQSEQLEENEKTPEGLLDGNIFDIKGVEGRGKTAIKHKLAEASLQGCKTIVLYFHENNTFLLQRIIDGYNHYLRNSNSKRINTVYYIVDGKLHRL
ncbi:MAG: hypothetical protein LBT94_04025 [Prevotellaceae bacterium]|jgi:hypothetical protein|nr:hypothetical protein [Prevotellaceae bacterium]